MDDDKPKLTGWNFDDHPTNYDPTHAQPVVSRPSTSSVATGMIKDTTEHVETKRLIRISLLLPVAIIIWIVSKPIGFALAAGIAFSMARAMARGNKSPARLPAVIMFSVIGAICAILAVLWLI